MMATQNIYKHFDIHLNYSVWKNTKIENKNDYNAMNNAKIRKEEIRTVGKDATGNRLLSSQIYAFAKAERLTRVILKTLPLSLFYTVYVS